MSIPTGERSIDSRKRRSLTRSARAMWRRASVPKPTATGGIKVASSAITGSPASESASR
jgi:hypothetical protein